MLGGVPWRDCDLEMWPFVERVWRKKPFAGSPQALTVPGTIDYTALPLWSSFILLFLHIAGLYLQNYTLRPILSLLYWNLYHSSFPFHLQINILHLILGVIISFFPFLASYHSRPPSPPHTHTLTVAMSMDAVASSMMRMLLFLTKARARQKSCLWPWLKFSPPSVTMASEGGKIKYRKTKHKCVFICRPKHVTSHHYLGSLEWNRNGPAMSFYVR